MKFSSVLRESFHMYRQHFRELMLTLLLELVLRLIALAPLLFLAARETRLLALLSLPLYLLIVLPARQNVAQGVQSLLDGGSLFGPNLLSIQDYGQKLKRSLLATLRMLMWSSLLIIGLLFAQWVWTADGNKLDALTVMRFIQRLGGSDLFRGLAVVVAGYLLTLIPVLIGCAFHSGDRHVAAMGRSWLMRGRRGALIRLWFGGLMVFLPFVIAAIFPCISFFRAMLSAFNEFMMTFIFTLPALGPTLIVTAILVIALLLPAIPLRTLMPAIYLKAAQANDPGRSCLIDDAA